MFYIHYFSLFSKSFNIKSVVMSLDPKITLIAHIISEEKQQQFTPMSAVLYLMIYMLISYINFCSFDFHELDYTFKTNLSMYS